MLFYRLELMTSTSHMTNITKLQGSGYLDMMRYSYVGFFSCFCEIRLTVSKSKAVLLLIHSSNLKEKMVIKPFQSQCCVQDLRYLQEVGTVSLKIVLDN